MNKKELIEFIQNHHSKEDTAYLCSLVEKEVLDVKDVFDLCSGHCQQQIVFRSAWLLECVFYEAPQKFTPILKDFLNKYASQKNESAQRHYSKIGMRLSQPKWKEYFSLSYTDLEVLTEAGFDWLINDKTPVAVKCNCMDILFQLSANEDWITDELKRILEQNLLSDSPALLSRTKRILKKMKTAKK